MVAGEGGNREFREPGLFRLTYRDTDYAGPTDEWRRIQSDTEAYRIAALARCATSTKKQKSSGGKRQVSVTETTTQTGKSPVVESATTGTG
jgi:hypothetical protein